MIPMQIRLEQGTLSLAASTIGLSVESTLEFAYVHECKHGLTLYAPGEDFACHDASCRPPTSGGTGGSRPGGASGTRGGTGYAAKAGAVGSSEHEKDMNIIRGDKEAGSVRADGILTEPWLNEKGEVVLTAKEEAKAHAALAKLGTSYDELVHNAQQVALNSMNTNPEQARRDAAWYQHEHETWGVPLAKEHGISVEQVMGIASVTSTNKRWDGVESSNKETVENILRYLKEDKPITITKEQADAYNAFSIDKPSGGGKYGPKTIEPGQYKLSELSSGTLGRVMGSGYKIGGQYFTDGLVKAFAIARGELEPNVAIPSLKQRSFVNNLSHPEIDYSSTNDFWMARALLGDKPLTNLPKTTGPTTVRQWEKDTGQKPNSLIGTRGSGTSSLFAIMTKASKQALDNLKQTDVRFKGMKTHEFQAVSWVQMQREYAAAGLEVDE